MSDLNIPIIKKEKEPEKVQEKKEEVKAPAPEPATAPPELPKPPDPFANVYPHDLFWRHFNDALEPAHGVLMTLTQPVTTGGMQNVQQTQTSEPVGEAQAAPAQAEGGFIAKYWPWLAIGGIGILVITFTLSYFRKKRGDEGDDYRRREPEPEPPPPPQPERRPINPIDDYLPYR